MCVNNNVCDKLNVCVCAWDNRSYLPLEKLTSGLFAGFPWNGTLPVDLSDKVVEDLQTNTKK